MADIKQAAKWMREGMAVRRADWKSLNPELAIEAVPAEVIFEIDGYGAGRDCVVNSSLKTHEMYFSTTALLADDWEIADD